MPGLVKFRVWLAVALAAGPIAYLLYQDFRESRRAETRSPSSEADFSSPPDIQKIVRVNASAPVNATALRFRPQADTRYVYTFERVILLQGFGKEQPKAGYRGELYLDVYRANANGFAAVVSERVEKFDAKRAVYLRIELDAKGENLQVFSAPLAGDEERERANVLRDLLANFCFSLSRDTVGRYRVEVTNLPDENSRLRRVKQKLAYLDGAKPLPEILDSSHLLTWDAQMAMPFAVAGQESTRLGQGQMSLSSKTTYAIQFQKMQPAPKLAKKLLDSLSAQATLALVPTKVAKFGNPEHEGVTWQQVLSRLENVANLSTNEQMQLFGDLVRLLRQGGKNISDLTALLSSDVMKQGAASQLFKTIVGALATAATKESQAALRDIYRHPDCPVNGKGVVLAALTTTQAALDAETRSFLMRSMRGEKNADLANGAAFALGSALQKAPNDRASQDAIVALSQAWYYQKKSENIEAKLVVLDAIGNSGRVEFLLELARTVRSDEPAPVRARALFAMRFIQSEASTRAISDGLRDPEPLVRAAAIEAIKLATWTEAFRGPVDACAKTETVAHIQSQCRSLLLQVAGN